MDHYPDPYDNESEKRSREHSWKALAVLAGLLAFCLLGIIALNLSR